jgi:hypothetical protein
MSVCAGQGPLERRGDGVVPASKARYWGSRIDLFGACFW